MFDVRLVMKNGAQYVERINAESAVNAAAKVARSHGYGKSDIYRATVNGEEVDRIRYFEV